MIHVRTAKKPKIKIRTRLHHFGRAVWEARFIYLILLPGFLYFAIFQYGPMSGLVLAFKKFNAGLGIWGSKWVGMQNFKRIFATPAAITAIRNTFEINLARLVFQFPVGILLAILLKPIDDAKVHEVMEQLWEKLDKTNRSLSELHSPGTFEKAIAYIEEHYLEAITLESVAKALFINKNYLSQLISKRKGETFIQYRNRLRVDYAKRLIRMGNHNMTDVAASAGFEDASQFSKIFRQIAGESPTGYRARCQARK